MNPTNASRITNAGSPDFDPDALKASLDLATPVNKDAGTADQLKRRVVKPINLMGGFLEFNIDFTNDAAALLIGKRLEENCFGVVYAIQGSNPAGMLRVQFEPNGGTFATLAPGARMRIPQGASSVTLTSVTGGPASGTARVVLLRTPNIDYTEVLTSAGGGSGVTPGGSGATGLGPGGATTQAVGVTTNVPTAATDGVSLTGVSGLRVNVFQNGTNTVTGGTVVWWYYNPITARWSEGQTQQVLAPLIGRTEVVGDDLQSFVPYGRAFPELRNFTVSAGTTVTALVQTWSK